MPSWQQRPLKKVSEICLMVGPNHTLVTLRWDGGHSSGHENVFWWFLNGYK